MYNDADIEMHEMRSEANSMSRASKKHGICFHGWLQGLTCKYCGKTFKSEEHLMEVIRELKIEWC